MSSTLRGKDELNVEWKNWAMLGAVAGESFRSASARNEWRVLRSFGRNALTIHETSISMSEPATRTL